MAQKKQWGMFAEHFERLKIDGDEISARDGCNYSQAEIAEMLLFDRIKELEKTTAQQSAILEYLPTEVVNKIQMVRDYVAKEYQITLPPDAKIFSYKTRFDDLTTNKNT